MEATEPPTKREANFSRLEAKTFINKRVRMSEDQCSSHIGKNLFSDESNDSQDPWHPPNKRSKQQNLAEWAIRTKQDKNSVNCLLNLLRKDDTTLPKDWDSLLAPEDRNIQKNDHKLLMDMKSVIVDLTTEVLDLKKEIIELKRTIGNHQEPTMPRANGLRDRFTKRSDFPLQTQEQIIHLDEDLLDSEEYQNLLKIISDFWLEVGAVKDMCEGYRSLLRRMFQLDLLRQLSWSASIANMIVVGKTRLFKAIQESSVFIDPKIPADLRYKNLKDAFFKVKDCTRKRRDYQKKYTAHEAVPNPPGNFVNCTDNIEYINAAPVSNDSSSSVMIKIEPQDIMYSD